MSYFDEEYMKKQKANVSTFIKRQEEFKKAFPEDKRLEIFTAQKAWDEEQMKKPVAEREIYTDMYGYQIVVVKTHKEPYLDAETGEPWNAPKEPQTPNENYPNEVEFPVNCTLLYNHKFKVKIDKGLIKGDIWNFLLLIRGEVYTMYQMLEDVGKRDSWKFREAFVARANEVNNTNCKWINEVDKDTYNRRFTFRVHQLLDHRKLEA